MNADTETIVVLKRLLNEMFDARERGVGGVRFARTHGYADGYMRALIETGLASQDDLLSFVLEERVRWSKSESVQKPSGLKSCKVAI